MLFYSVFNGFGYLYTRASLAGRGRRGWPGALKSARCDRMSRFRGDFVRRAKVFAKTADILPNPIPSGESARTPGWAHLLTAGCPIGHCRSIDRTPVDTPPDGRMRPEHVSEH